MNSYFVLKGDFSHVTDLYDFEAEMLQRQGFQVTNISNLKRKKAMSNIKVNFSVKAETAAGIELLANETHRGKGDVIDWLVADALDRIDQAHRETVTVEEVVDQPFSSPNN